MTVTYYSDNFYVCPNCRKSVPADQAHLCDISTEQPHPFLEVTTDNTESLLKENNELLKRIIDLLNDIKRRT